MNPSTSKALTALTCMVLFIFLLCISFPGKKQTNKQNVDLLIRNGTIITMDNGKIIENGSIAIDNGKIIAIGSGDEITGKYSAAETLEANDQLVIPGLVNTHNHAAMALFRGISDDRELMDWLNNFIFPAEAKNVSADFVRAGTKLAIAEMIKGGTTTYCDMYYFEDDVADETAKAGMRGVLGETVIEFRVNDNDTSTAALAYCEKFIAKWKDHPLVTPALAPHAPYTVFEETLKKVTALSGKLNAPVIMHIAETRSEVETIKAQKGTTPVRYLDRIGFLNNRVVAAHVVMVGDTEIDILKSRGVGVAHNPTSNMKLASGVCPVPQMLLKDVALGIGTDGCASNNDLDLWEEMDMAAKLHKVFTMDPKVVLAEQAFSMATIGGARALHMEDKIGSLAVGKLADIVLVNTNGLHQIPFYNYYSLLVYATKSCDVSSVIINGKVVMKYRRLLTLDEEEIKKTANVYRDKIKRSLEKAD